MTEFETYKEGPQMESDFVTAKQRLLVNTLLWPLCVCVCVCVCINSDLQSVVTRCIKSPINQTINPITVYNHSYTGQIFKNLQQKLHILAYFPYFDK
jgi:hypothetical protein